MTYAHDNLGYLEGCSGEEKSVGGMVVLVEDLGQLAVVVLHPVTLIYYHVLPVNLVEKATNHQNITHEKILFATIGRHVLPTQLLEALDPYHADLFNAAWMKSGIG